MDLQLLGTIENSPFYPKLSKRILHKHLDKGWTGLIDRIVEKTAEVEKKFAEEDQAEFLANLRVAFEQSEFLPNSPLMVNISEDKPTLFACYALDARKPMKEFLHTARNVHDGMGGIGYSLEHMKESYEIKKFIRTVDEDTIEHQASRPRPASNAVTMSITNPGFEALLKSAGKTKVTNLNVGLSNAFMKSVKAGDEQAKNQLLQVAQTIHRTGQPAILFSDNIPQVAVEKNATFAANVCGESPLAADESALLGSLNLVKFLKDEEGLTFDFERMKAVIRLGVRFLDDMHNQHYHVSDSLRSNSLATRKIGLGLMGYAHVLALLGIRYGSEESIQLAEKISRIMMEEATAESKHLAKVRGSYPAAAANNDDKRNALLVAIAQTSTLSLLVHTSGGIEPIHGYMVKQTFIDEDVYILDPVVAYFADKQGIPATTVIEQLQKGQPLQSILGEEIAHVLPQALHISPEDQLAVQAAFQRYIDGGISKTINCKKETTVEEIYQWIVQGYDANVLGFMIYRDRSLDVQPVEVVS